MANLKMEEIILENDKFGNLIHDLVEAGFKVIPEKEGLIINAEFSVGSSSESVLGVISFKKINACRGPSLDMNNHYEKKYPSVYQRFFDVTKYYIDRGYLKYEG